jgi:agmatine deiminase
MKQLFSLLILMSLNNVLQAQTYTMPDEADIHEGTWLQWPHQYEYGTAYRNSLDATWVAMTMALQANEKVHIIAYNNTEKTRIINKLTAASVPLTNVDFQIYQTNDVWVRDNGPIFVKNVGGALNIDDWGFNGWGGKYGYAKCNPIPTSISTSIGMPVINLNSIMTIEGGSVEMDADKVLMATRSSIISQSPANSIRNLGMTQAQAEAKLTQYLGATKFIWLNGGFSADDVTDMHIDGFVKFAPTNKIVTMSNADLLYWGLTQADINTLYAATNLANQPYTFVYLPLTQNNVVTQTGIALGFKGSYINYYVANNRVLVPNYSDPNDAIANAAIGALYPGRTVVGIDVRNLYENGGMVHCVTQQQPVASAPLPITLFSFSGENKNNNVELKWQTATELNASHFEVERSIDGLVFQKLAKINVKNEANSTYTYVDTDFPNGKPLYYRLKMVDIDQKFEYSKIISLQITSTTDLPVVQPNPSQNDIEIWFNNNDGVLQIYNVSGQIVKTIPNYQNGTKISIADLPSNIYYFNLFDKNYSNKPLKGSFVKK